ncbi:MAG: cellulose biosynthesis protein BcsF [Succinivibrio sp.]|nr:cellulose biosynthesis protein BcsF [Succinivibrio sp.]
MMLHTPLYVSDILELVLLCALIFLPTGYVLHRYLPKLILTLRLFLPAHTLTDRGTFKDYLKDTYLKSPGAGTPDFRDTDRTEPEMTDKAEQTQQSVTPPSGAELTPKTETEKKASS